MGDIDGAASGWSAWLPQEASLHPDGAEDLVLNAIGVFQRSGRFLYIKATTDLAEFSAGERRILAALTRQGDTVFVAVAPDSGQVRLCYRMPDLDNAVAFDGDGLRGLIQQWLVWASATETPSA